MTCTYPHCEPGQAGTHCRAECRHKRLPKGCDQQGRYPEAAEACTDIGADDRCVEAVSIAAVSVVVALVTVAAITAVVLAYFL
jgi:hypothetical protein